MSKFGNAFKSGFKTSLEDSKVGNFGEALGKNIGGLSNAIGGIAGNLIGNGFQSTAGNITNTVADLASAIPGPFGGILGGGLKIAGGAVNAHENPVFSGRVLFEHGIPPRMSYLRVCF